MFEDALKVNESGLEIEPSILKDLPSLYAMTVVKLSECALHQPGLDSAQDGRIDLAEAKLLSAQEKILDSAARATITSDQEAANVLKLWLKVVQEKSELSDSDQLIMPLYHYLHNRGEI